MKKVVYILLGFLIVTAMIGGIGCTSKEEPPVTTTNITGTVTGNPITTTGGNQTITITTPSGAKVFPVSPTASITFAGKACSVDEFDQYVADNVTYNCTIVYDDMVGAVAVYVTGP